MEFPNVWFEITESSQQNMSSVFKLPKVGLEEIKKKKVAFAKELAAELLGTMLLVMIGCGSAMSGDGEDGEGQMSECHRIGEGESSSICFIPQVNRPSM